MKGQIRVPEWFKKENPTLAGVCEMINVALQNRPNLSLAEFAEQIDASIVETAYMRLQAVEKRQFDEIFGNGR